MLSDVFCARRPRHVSPHAFSRIRDVFVYSNLAYSNLAYSNLAGGYSG